MSPPTPAPMELLPFRDVGGICLGDILQGFRISAHVDGLHVAQARAGRRAAACDKLQAWIVLTTGFSKSSTRFSLTRLVACAGLESELCVLREALVAVLQGHEDLDFHLGDAGARRVGTPCRGKRAWPPAAATPSPATQFPRNIFSSRCCCNASSPAPTSISAPCNSCRLR